MKQVSLELSRRESLRCFGRFLATLPLIGHGAVQTAGVMAAGTTAATVFTACAQSDYAFGRVITAGLLQAPNAYAQDVLTAICAQQGVTAEPFLSLLVLKAYPLQGDETEEEVSQILTDPNPLGWEFAIPPNNTSKKIDYPALTPVRAEIARYPRIPISSNERPGDVYPQIIGSTKDLDTAVVWLKDGSLFRQIDLNDSVYEPGEIVFAWRSA
jgi:hypothetical protein